MASRQPDRAYAADCKNRYANVTSLFAFGGNIYIYFYINIYMTVVLEYLCSLLSLNEIAIQIHQQILRNCELCWKKYHSQVAALTTQKTIEPK